MRARTFLVPALFVASIACGQDHAGFYRQAMLAMRSGASQEAITHFTQFLALDQSYAKAWYFRGLCRGEQGDLVGALGDVERALELERSEPYWLLRRAELQMQAERPVQAAQTLNELLGTALDPDLRARALELLGNAQLDMDRPWEAAHTFGSLLQLFPNHALAHYGRGLARTLMQDTTGALADLGHAVRLDPTQAKAYSARAYLLVKNARPEEACADLETAKMLGDTAVDELLAIHCW
jgi:tetratricopeptide (TPR) repeat protein